MNDLERSAMEQALEALETCDAAHISDGGRQWYDDKAVEEAITALRAALAEPVQEPYCHVYEYDSVFGLHREFYPREYNGRKPDRTVPLFTAPPQRKPLTDEQIDAACGPCDDSDLARGFRREFIKRFRVIYERVHGIGGKDGQV